MNELPQKPMPPDIVIEGPPSWVFDLLWKIAIFVLGVDFGLLLEHLTR